MRVNLYIKIFRIKLHSCNPNKRTHIKNISIYNGRSHNRSLTTDQWRKEVLRFYFRGDSYEWERTAPCCVVFKPVIVIGSEEKPFDSHGTLFPRWHAYALSYKYGICFAYNAHVNDVNFSTFKPTLILWFFDAFWLLFFLLSLTPVVSQPFQSRHNAIWYRISIEDSRCPWLPTFSDLCLIFQKKNSRLHPFNCGILKRRKINFKSEIWT
jgi:hypothetical protein